MPLSWFAPDGLPAKRSRQARFLFAVLAALVVFACLASWSNWPTREIARPDGAGGAGSPASTPRWSANVTDVAPDGSLAERCRERAVRLPQQLDGPCPTIVRPPFVLGGNLSEAELQGKWESVIQPACDVLLARYFRRLPQHPVVILMFRTEAAYREAAEQLFFDRGVSRFGYYKPGRQAVLVNLESGDGTLLHELTHVLMDADFPNAPQWLQEGIATLYEASEPGGTPLGSDLTPMVNWRGAILRRAQQENRLPSTGQWLEAATFCGAREALDYAYARYLCWFLHRRALLPRYYAALRERAEQDPTGRKTLLGIGMARDGESLDREFRTWLAESDDASQVGES